MVYVVHTLLCLITLDTGYPGQCIYCIFIYSYIKSKAQQNILVRNNMKISLFLIIISTFVFSPYPISGETLKLHFHVRIDNIAKTK